MTYVINEPRIGTKDISCLVGGLSQMLLGAGQYVLAERCYAALLLFLAVSVLVGSSLGGALPG